MDLSNYLKKENEKPLDTLVSDGGLCSILRKVICIGDSLSSGEFEILNKDGNKEYYDMFEFSWGQFMARIAGIKVLNYSRGGMTAKEYYESYAEQKGWWDVNEKANAYIIALGVNDLNQEIGLGSIEDIDLKDYRNNKETYLGYYAKIVQRYKLISPNAKFFFVTMPYLVNCNKEKYDKGSELLYKLAKVMGNSYIIDLKKYGPDYTAKEFRDTFFMNDHLTPSGYLLTAKMIISYIDYIIRNNPKDFNCVGFYGTLDDKEKLLKI